MKRILLALAASVSLLAQSPSPIQYPVVGSSAFNTPMMQENQAVPTTPTVITTRSLILGGGWIECSTSRTITITDGNGVTVFPAIPITAPAIVSLTVWAGSFFSGGFSISASGSGCTYQMFWRQ